MLTTELHTLRVLLLLKLEQDQTCCSNNTDDGKPNHGIDRIVVQSTKELPKYIDVEYPRI